MEDNGRDWPCEGVVGVVKGPSFTGTWYVLVLRRLVIRADDAPVGRKWRGSRDSPLALAHSPVLSTAATAGSEMELWAREIIDQARG